MKYTDLNKTYNKFFNTITTAFQENDIPTDIVVNGELKPVTMPYLTYQVIDSNRNSDIMQVNVYSNSTSYKELTEIINKIDENIGEGITIEGVEGTGYITMYKGVPFSQNFIDATDKEIKRALINLEITTY